MSGSIAHLINGLPQLGIGCRYVRGESGQLAQVGKVEHPALPGGSVALQQLGAELGRLGVLALQYEVIQIPGAHLGEK
jgi:hypothetical protein